jgi:hypothetical protein
MQMSTLIALLMAAGLVFLIARAIRSNAATNDQSGVTAVPAGDESFVCAVVGESFKNDDGSDRQQIIAALRKGDWIDLVPEPDNPKDKHAVKVMSPGGQIGYLKRDVARRLSQKLAAGARVTARVHRVGRGGKNPNRGVFLSVGISY